MNLLTPTPAPASTLDTEEERVPAPVTRVALAGAGYIASYHLDALRRLGRVEVVGICDPNAARREELRRQYGLPLAAASLDELLHEAKPDVVHVVVPPAFHFEVAEQALRAGTHVLLEKPMVLNREQCTKLLDLADARNLLAGVNHNAVYHPLFQRLLADIAQGKLGRVEHVVSTNNLPLAQLESGEHDHWMFRTPVNVLFEQGPHPLSQVCELLGGVREARTLRSGERKLRGGARFFSTWQTSLVCERGTAQLSLSFGGSFPDARLHVIGQDGTAHLDLIQGAYVLDRRTRYLEPVDRSLRCLSRGWQTARDGVAGFTHYALAMLRLASRSDAFYRGMCGSIGAFYRTLQEEKDWHGWARRGRQVTEGLERIAEEFRDEPVSASAPSPTPARIRQGDVLVLGGTGFIGRHLVPALAGAGYPVRLLMRRPSLLPETFREAEPQVVAGDIRNPDDVRRAVKGCRAVIHLVAGAPSSWQEYERLYLGGTRLVAEAVLDEKDCRLFFASSIAAYYLGRQRDTITEATPLDDRLSRRSEYPRVKVLCEQLLTELHRTRGLPVTIFRPGVVVGAGGLIEHSGVGYWPCPTHCIAWGRGVTHPLPFVLARDVAAAFVQALDTPGVEGKSFNLVGDVQLTAAEYVDLLRELSGRDIRLHRTSLLHLWATDLFKWLVKAIARKPGNVFPSYRDLASRSLAAPFDCTFTKRMLGWQPVADREEFVQLALRDALAGREAV